MFCVPSASPPVPPSNPGSRTATPFNRSRPAGLQRGRPRAHPSVAVSAPVQRPPVVPCPLPAHGKNIQRIRIPFAGRPASMDHSPVIPAPAPGLRALAHSLPSTVPYCAWVSKRQEACREDGPSISSRVLFRARRGTHRIVRQGTHGSHGPVPGMRITQVRQQTPLQNA